MTTILSLCLAAAVAVLAYKRRDWAIAIVVATMPLYVARLQLFGLPLTALELVILAVTAAWVLKLATDYEERSYAKLLLKQRSIRIAYIMAAFVLAAGTLALFTTPEFIQGLGLWKAYIVEPVLLFIVALHTLRSPQQVITVVRAGLMSATVVASIAIAQYATGFGIPAPWDAFPERRATAHYGYPNAVGLFIAPLLTYAIGRLLFSWRTIQTNHKRALLITIPVLCAALVAARVEGAIVAVLAGTFVLLLATRARWLAIVTATIGLALGLLIEPIRRILLFQDTSGDVRLALWRGTWNLLSDRPWFGAGLSGFRLTYDDYRLDQHVELLQYPHNIFLNFWTELGFAGLVWLVITLVMVIAVLIPRIRTAPSKTLSYLPITLLAVFVSIVVYGLVDVPVMKNDLSALFAIWLTLVTLLTTKQFTRT